MGLLIRLNNHLSDVRDFSKIEIVDGGGYLYTAEKCGTACSRNDECLIWDYNIKTQECRLFVTSSKFFILILVENYL